MHAAVQGRQRRVGVCVPAGGHGERGSWWWNLGRRRPSCAPITRDDGCAIFRVTSSFNIEYYLGDTRRRPRAEPASLLVSRGTLANAQSRARTGRTRPPCSSLGGGGRGSTSARTPRELRRLFRGCFTGTPTSSSWTSPRGAHAFRAWRQGGRRLPRRPQVRSRASPDDGPQARQGHHRVPDTREDPRGAEDARGVLPGPTSDACTGRGVRIGASRDENAARHHARGRQRPGRAPPRRTTSRVPTGRRAHRVASPPCCPFPRTGRTQLASRGTLDAAIAALRHHARGRRGRLEAKAAHVDESTRRLGAPSRRRRTTRIVEFTHPSSGERVRVVSPPPSHMSLACEARLRQAATTTGVY